MTNPAQLAAQIRFQLEQLSAQNGHHEFEKLCFWLTKERLCRNVSPATGPVSAGGDQGRDFETFSTFLSSIVEREEYFAGQGGSVPIAFACSLDKEFAQKIKSDVVKILGGGTPVGAVVFFAGCDIPVAKRHELEGWALTAHAVKLQIHDAQAVAVLLGGTRAVVDRSRVSQNSGGGVPFTGIPGARLRFIGSQHGRCL